MPSYGALWAQSMSFRTLWAIMIMFSIPSQTKKYCYPNQNRQFKFNALCYLKLNSKTHLPNYKPIQLSTLYLRHRTDKTTATVTVPETAHNLWALREITARPTPGVMNALYGP